MLMTGTSGRGRRRPACATSPQRQRRRLRRRTCVRVSSRHLLAAGPHVREARRLGLQPRYYRGPPYVTLCGMRELVGGLSASELDAAPWRLRDDVHARAHQNLAASGQALQSAEALHAGAQCEPLAGAPFACFTSTKVQILTRLRQLLLRPLSSGGRTCSASTRTSVLRDPHAFIHQAVQDAVRASASGLGNVAASQLPAVSSY